MKIITHKMALDVDKRINDMLRFVGEKEDVRLSASVAVEYFTVEEIEHISDALKHYAKYLRRKNKV